MAGCALPARLSAPRWLWRLLIMGAIVLGAGGSAWALGFDITVDNGRISGYARQAPLGAVLGRLAEQGGYAVYVDDQLIEAPTSFDLPTALPAEEAIERMVHPHSYAILFTKIPGRQQLSIAEIKVYAKGNQNAAFVRMTGDQAVPGISSYARGGSTDYRDRSANGVQSGLAYARKQVRAPVNITASAMGFSGFNFKDRRRGPDYRPDTLSAAKAYSEYRQQRDALSQRNKKAQITAARQSVENAKNAYRSQRDASIQQTIQESSR